MANTYYTLLTQAGQASIANAIALGQQVTLTHMAVGDGNGSPTVPKETQTELVQEVYRAAINQLLTDPDNPNYLIAEMIVPTNVGGWFVREVGLFDEDDNLLAIANFPETYKPKLEEGSGRDLIIRIILQVQSTDAITLKIDPTIVLASQAWVKENFTRAILLPGGTTSQFLAKKSNADGDTEWKDLEIPEQVNADWNATEGAAQILNKPTLSAVATSGQYSDLAGTPDIIATACPVGMIYIQYAGQAAPADLFGGIWDNISNTYAGLFFRTEGGAAAAFGETQGGGAPNITGELTGLASTTNSPPSGSGAFIRTGTGSGFTGGPAGSVPLAFSNFSFSASNISNGYSINEFRPANSTIRIWKRTA